MHKDNSTFLADCTLYMWSWIYVLLLLVLLEGKVIWQCVFVFAEGQVTARISEALGSQEIYLWLCGSKIYDLFCACVFSTGKKKIWLRESVFSGNGRLKGLLKLWVIRMTCTLCVILKMNSLIVEVVVVLVWEENMTVFLLAERKLTKWLMSVWYWNQDEMEPCLR